MADIFDSYRLAEAWDEMFAAPGQPRKPYHSIMGVLQPMDPAELRFRADHRLAAMVVTTDVAVPREVVREIVVSDGFENGWTVTL